MDNNPYDCDDSKTEKENLDELAKLNYEAAKPFIQAFNNEAGQVCLDKMKEMFTEQPVAIPNDGDACVRMAFFREGQNSVVRMIENFLVEANTND